MTQTKFTPLEIQIITDRPEDCIVEHLCDDQEGNRNNSDEILIEHRQGHTQMWENKVYPEKMCDDAISNLYWHLREKKSLPENLTELDKEILDNCISCGTWDRADEVSPQFWGATKRAVRSIAEKFHNLNIEISYLDLN
tara:strand:+ start:42 stop:458 length:417 start_codon:yes stop_codon:yes gene_type:complete